MNLISTGILDELASHAVYVFRFCRVSSYKLNVAESTWPPQYHVDSMHACHSIKKIMVPMSIIAFFTIALSIYFIMAEQW